MESDEWMQKFEASCRVYYQNIGEMVVYWNACEGRLRDMVIWLSGGRTAANLALTAHMSAKALVDALPTLTGMLSPTVRDLFEHYAKAVDILRDHRNYYTHGIELVSIQPRDAGSAGPLPPEAYVYITQITGRNQLKLYQQKVELADIANLKRYLLEYQIYGFNLLSRAFPDFRNAGSRSSESPWPAKPALPDRIRKSPPILLGVQSPLGSPSG